MREQLADQEEYPAAFQAREGRFAQGTKLPERLPRFGNRRRTLKQRQYR